MPRPLRFATQSWQPVEITARTLQGRFLLRPSTRLNLLIAGILSLAKERYGVRIYNLVFLSNHFHIIAAAPSPCVMSGFMRFVMSNIAREVGRIYDWPGRFWERRYSAIPIADDASLIHRMRYVFENGCKEGLVSHPAEWAGLNGVEALTTGSTIEGIWVNRTALYLASKGKNRKDINEEDYTQRRELSLDPLPLWEGMSPKRLYRAAAALVSDTAKSTLPKTRENQNAREKVAKRSPHHRPAKLKRGFAPLCHASSKAIADAFRAAYRAFVAAYRTASEKLAQRLPHMGFPIHSQVMAFAVLSRETSNYRTFPLHVAP